MTLPCPSCVPSRERTGGQTARLSVGRRGGTVRCGGRRGSSQSPGRGRAGSHQAMNHYRTFAFMLLVLVPAWADASVEASGAQTEQPEAGAGRDHQREGGHNQAQGSGGPPRWPAPHRAAVRLWPSRRRHRHDQHRGLRDELGRRRELLRRRRLFVLVPAGLGGELDGLGPGEQRGDARRIRRS